ncbi:MAG: hypothetical protein ACRENE_05220, partial [Polyangiaceae bacterium]
MVAAACGLATEGTLIPLGSTGPGGDDATAPHGSSGSQGSSSGFNLGDDGASSGGFYLGDDGGTPPPDDASDDSLPPPSKGPCNYDGVWASRLTVDVSWSPQGLTSIVLASGSGKIEQWIRGTRSHQGSTLTDSTVVCGIVLPDFQSTALAATETYGVRFPPTLFDNHYLPLFDVTGTISGNMAGATYSTTNTAALLGVTLQNPSSESWPSSP